jgi:hypothetical protein
MHRAQLRACLKDQRDESPNKSTSKLIAWRNKMPTNIVTKVKWLDTYASEYGIVELVIDQKSWYVNLTHTNTATMTKNQTNIHQDRKSNNTALSTMKEILIYVQTTCQEIYKQDG